MFTGMKFSFFGTLWVMQTYHVLSLKRCVKTYLATLYSFLHYILHLFIYHAQVWTAATSDVIYVVSSNIYSRGSSATTAERISSLQVSYRHLSTCSVNAIFVIWVTGWEPLLSHANSF